MIKCKNVKKQYGRIEALRGITLHVKKGEFITIFGPNGAGKTTLLKILSNVIKFSEGTIQISGKDILSHGEEIRQKIGVISHNSYLYNNLSPFENLKFFGNLYGVSNLNNRIYEVISRVDLSERIYDPVGTFSRGMQQRVSIARAIIHNPSILLLDEPYTGLDQHAAYVLKDILSSLKDGKRTIIMTTHNISRGIEICNSVAIQVKGKIVLKEPIERINKKSFEETYFLQVKKGVLS